VTRSRQSAGRVLFATTPPLRYLGFVVNSPCAARGRAPSQAVLKVKVAVLPCFAFFVSGVLSGAATRVQAQGVDASMAAIAGLSFTEQDQRLPASPLVGLQATSTMRLTDAVYGFDPFVGGEAVAMVTHPEADRAVVDYLVSGRAGIRMKGPGELALFGLLGAGWPQTERTWDSEMEVWEGGDALIYGGGIALAGRGLLGELRILLDRRLGDQPVVQAVFGSRW